MKPGKLKSNSIIHIPLTKRLLALAAGICFGLASVAGAQTIISGPNISGTWSPSGNPYIVSGNVTVSSGQTLTIQPGVVVWIGSGVSITNNGLIQAVGTPSERIEFQAPISSQYWNTILNNYSGATNLFTFCDFQNAQTAISMVSYANNANMTVEILNCTFSNCVSQGILGRSQGLGGSTSTGFSAYNAALTPVIENCTFSTMSNGCVITMLGNSSGLYGYATGYGYVYSTLSANIFQDLSGAAFLMQVGSYAGGGTTVFINNTIVDCQGGINAADPWNAQIENNIFVGCTNAVVDTGTLSRQVSYNDFYGNATNFTGYAATYGDWIIPNRNGTLADILYNISQNPLFVATNDFHLQATSPCVNAGVPGEAYENMCFPPSIGTAYGDIGAYGGPYAGNWLTNVPLLAAQSLSISNSGTAFLLDWFDVPRSTYQIQYATNLLGGSNLWQNLPNGQVVASGTPSSLSVAPFPPTNSARFYRIQSLGRTPGN